MRFRTILKTLIWSQRRVLFWTGLIFAIIIGYGLLHSDAILEYQQTLTKRNEERQAVEKIENNIARLESERETLQNGGFEHAKVARQRYRLSKPGEYVLYLEDASENTTDTTTPKALPPNIKPALPGM